MDETDFRKLETLAVAFHGAIEQTDLSYTGVNLKDFPSECCHHACTLLGIFLFEHGVENLQKIVGDCPDDANGQHLWIEVDGVIVDITAYQFAGILERVIVKRISKWHSALNGCPSRFASGKETVAEYFSRRKDHYNMKYDSLYDNLANLANESVLE